MLARHMGITQLAVEYDATVMLHYPHDITHQRDYFCADALRPCVERKKSYTNLPFYFCNFPSCVCRLWLANDASTTSFPRLFCNLTS